MYISYSISLTLMIKLINNIDSVLYKNEKVLGWSFRSIILIFIVNKKTVGLISKELRLC